MSEEEWFNDKDEDGDADEYEEQQRREPDFNHIEEDDMNDFKRSKLDGCKKEAYSPPPTPRAALAAAAAAAAAGQLVPYDCSVPTQENRPEYTVVDNVSYYKHLSMWTQMYAQATTGFVPTPVLNLG